MLNQNIIFVIVLFLVVILFLYQLYFFNFFSNDKDEKFKNNNNLVGAANQIILNNKYNKPNNIIKNINIHNNNLYFSCRNKWFNKILHSLNQGTCNTCWAFSISTCLTDRFKIKYDTFDNVNDYLSPHYLAGCILNKLSNPNINVCKNFYYMEDTLDYIIKYGIIKNSNMNSINGYKCINTNNITLYKAKSYKKITSKVNNIIEDEIQNNGTVCAVIQTSSEYYNNNGQIYGTEKNINFFQEKHVLCIIGFGVDEHNISFWLCRDSRGKEDIRIKRGTNFAGIESQIYFIYV